MVEASVASAAEPRARLRASARATWPAWLRENLEHSLPILIFGGVLVVLGLWLHFTHAGFGGGRYPLWTLLAAVGVVLAAGGFALTIVDDAPEPELPDPARFVTVERSEWERVNAAASTRPPWEESEPETPPPSVAGGVLAPAGAPAAAFDPWAPEASASSAMVQELSEMLLSRSRATVGASAVASPSRSAPPAPPPARAASTTEARPPIWSEDPVPATRSAWEPPEPAADAPEAVRPAEPEPPKSASCAACGTPLEVGDDTDQCVLCDRPMCSACRERSFVEGRPGLCPECDMSRRYGPTVTG